MMKRTILFAVIMTLWAVPAVALTGDVEFGNDPTGGSAVGVAPENGTAPAEPEGVLKEKKPEPKKPHPGDIMIIKKGEPESPKEQ
ncbi:hypothetical protein [Salidesulfovibrio brasiliensis]|uniref:hypothetical protein n=1 Tax=Salidesulfovibrio brasiliensis TaxID=221711 RepID=UPI0006D0E5F8|nr:hypothetical protein [Salidesulfovibrio brasiliensis]